MVLVGPENILPEEQVVALVGLRESTACFECEYEVRHPLTGHRHRFTLEVPREVTPLSPEWARLDEVFARLFSRREFMLVYRDQAKARILEGIYARTKSAPPPEPREPGAEHSA